MEKIMQEYILFSPFLLCSFSSFLFICLYTLMAKRFVVIKYCEKKKRINFVLLAIQAIMFVCTHLSCVVYSSYKIFFVQFSIQLKTTKKRQKLISFLALDIKHHNNRMYSSFFCQIKEGSLGKATLFFCAHSYNNAL